MKNEKPLRRKDVALLLGVSRQTVDNYRKKGYLHPQQYIADGICRYDLKEVLAFKAGRNT